MNLVYRGSVEPLSGKDLGLIYSLSRWTDLPVSKWDWFRHRLTLGWMYGIDPRDGVPAPWSLHPDDTLGLVFWTRNPANLIRYQHLLEPYKVKVHVTLTGWHEVERGVPDVHKGVALLDATIRAFGADSVVWRFSPVPTVGDVVERYERIARVAVGLGLRSVYVAFLQDNDLMKEPRGPQSRALLLQEMAAAVPNLEVVLCHEDDTLRLSPGSGIGYGICESGKDFVLNAPREPCGCALAVDPFTINETCRASCSYCYAADRSLAPKKRNTTKGALPVLD